MSKSKQNPPAEDDEAMVTEEIDETEQDSLEDEEPLEDAEDAGGRGKKEKPPKDDAEYEGFFSFYWRRMKHRKHKRKKGRGLSMTLVLLTLVLSASVVLSVSILAVAKEMYGIDKDVSEKVINIPAGATTQDIAEQLVQEHMISLPQVFRFVSRMNGMDGSYIAGEHVLSPAMSYQAMINELCKNYADERDYVTVTFREGISIVEAAQILEENEVCSASEFLFFFDAGGFGFPFEQRLPEPSTMKFHQMEGYCFPDTYDFYVDEDPAIVAQKIYENFDSKLTDGDYAKMDELDMTLDEVITLASIVQAEAPTASSMKMVSSVFHNRLLNTTMFPKLQSDPTRKYAEEVIKPNMQVSNDMILDAYNTYNSAGLPPGAINNPGLEAIRAVLYPADTNYYFFAANVQTGEIFYATTNEEHNANLAKIDAQQKEAGLAAEGE